MPNERVPLLGDGHQPVNDGPQPINEVENDEEEEEFISFPRDNQ